MALNLEAFFDNGTNTLTYIVFDESTFDAIIIDPVLDYEQASSQISNESSNKLLHFVKEKSLKVHYILETHVHADHLSSAQDLKDKIPGSLVAINKNIIKVQETFKGVYNLPELKIDGSQFDKLLDNESLLEAGTIKIKTLFTPGHTPACSSFLIDDMLFTGDALFMPDSGTGRCDFPAGSASELYHSVHEIIYKLPDETRIFTAHDYQPNGRELKYQSTIGESKKQNIQLKEETTESEYIKFREERDVKLSTPRLLLPSIQVNIDGGKLPESESNGVSYLKIPLIKKGP